MTDIQHTILLVEDDTAVRESIDDLITMGGYKCVCAVNGREGLRLASTVQPDLIITDVMMPEMDGFMLVEALHADPQLAHIPVIILTAKVSDKDRIAGLELGAVDYLTKPFNGRELTLRIRNILNQQENYRIKNLQDLIAASLDEEKQDEDAQFFQSFYREVATNLESAAFGVPDLAAALNISERNLYRKVKVFTGMTVASFIREVRLQKARQLLDSNERLTRTEVAAMVGFRSPAHFSKAYNKRFSNTAPDA